MNSFAPLIGIDAGSERIRVWSSAKRDKHDENETIFDEAACLAVERSSQKVIQVGDEAAAMLGRVGEEIKVIYPIRRGEVAHPDYFRALVQVMLQKVTPTFSLARPTLMISVPASMSFAKRQVLTELLQGVGVHEVYTISQSLASAIGAGVPIADATGSFMLQAGAGVVEVTVISLGSSVAFGSTWYAGHWLDEYIQMHLAKHLSLTISLGTARRLKHEVVSLIPDETEHLVSGQDVSSASPRELPITAADLAAPVELFTHQYEQMLKHLLAQLPPELSVDVIDKGLLMAGGLAQLRGLDEYLIETLGVPVSVVENPQQTVIKGIATALQHLDEFKHSLGYMK